MKKLMFLVWISGCALDGGTTHFTLTHSTQVRETVLSQNPYVDDVITLGEAEAGAEALRVLHHTRPKLAEVIGIAGGILRITIAAHNMNVYHQVTR